MYVPELRFCRTQVRGSNRQRETDRDHHDRSTAARCDLSRLVRSTRESHAKDDTSADSLHQGPKFRLVRPELMESDGHGIQGFVEEAYLFPARAPAALRRCPRRSTAGDRCGLTAYARTPTACPPRSRQTDPHAATPGPHWGSGVALRPSAFAVVSRPSSRARLLSGDGQQATDACCSDTLRGERQRSHRGGHWGKHECGEPLGDDLAVDLVTDEALPYVAAPTPPHH